MMASNIDALVLSLCDAEAIQSTSRVQRLWSDYGEILRLQLSGGSAASLILKRVQPPDRIEHPRGWSNNTSMERKRKSYEVEANWYEYYAANLAESCRVPKPVAIRRNGSQILILMEDLSMEYGLSRSRLSPDEAQTCLAWLAAFHAQHVGTRDENHPSNESNHEQDWASGLWPIGTYWHLGTRAEEFNAMPEGLLKQSAHKLDAKLSGARYQCIVHGDAKVANFCFSEDMKACAAVDFQYAGKGVGVRDVAYFLGSCLPEAVLEQSAESLLDYYFKQLRRSLEQLLQNKRQLQGLDLQALEQEWRDLYPVAWVDFHRFLVGWAPGHEKLNAYSRSLCKKLLG